MADVLVVTTAVGVVDGVHGDTADLGPAVALDAVLVELVAGLEDGLVDAAAAGDETDDSAASGSDSLASARRETDASLEAVVRVTDDDGRDAGSLGERATVADVVLDGRDDSTLGQTRKRKDVADSKLSRLAAVDELAGVETLDGDEEVLHGLVPVRIAEDHAGERSATSGVVKNVRNQTLHVPVALGEVERTELRSTLTASADSLEDQTSALTLSTDYATH